MLQSRIYIQLSGQIPKTEPSLTCTPEKKKLGRDWKKNKRGLQRPKSGRTQVKSVLEREKHILMEKTKNRSEADGSEEWRQRRQQEILKFQGNINGDFK